MYSQPFNADNKVHLNFIVNFATFFNQVFTKNLEIINRNEIAKLLKNKNLFEEKSTPGKEERDLLEEYHHQLHQIQTNYDYEFQYHLREEKKY